MKRLSPLAALLLSLALSPLAPARAQTTWPAPNPKSPTSISIPLHPVAPVGPDLHYQLLPRAIDTHPGNAAIAYATAASLIPPDRPADEAATLDNLRHVPLDALDEAAATAILERHAAALAALRTAARYDSVDWQVPFRTQGFAAVNTPNLGSFRHLTNVLTLAIRLDLKHKNFPAAHDKLQTGFALAHHLGQSDTLLQQLVAAAIANVMTHELEEWIGTPDAPNLFWPIANLPRPFLDFPRAVAAERDVIYFTVPELRDMRAGIPLSNDAWTSFANRFAALSSGAPTTDSPPRDPWQRQAIATGYALLFYPAARQYLLTHHPMTPDQLDQLSVAQTLGKYFPDSYDETVDQTFRYLPLPPALALPGLREAEKNFSTGRSNPNLLARILLPSLSRATYVTANVNRTLDMLQTLEALRAHAAQNHNTLPAALTDIHLPIPLDPFTNTPFTYAHTPTATTLTSTPPSPTSPTETLQYTLTSQ
jgi:hypothetical protein